MCSRPSPFHCSERCGFPGQARTNVLWRPYKRLDPKARAVRRHGGVEVGVLSPRHGCSACHERRQVPLPERLKADGRSRARLPCDRVTGRRARRARASQPRKGWFCYIPERGAILSPSVEDLAARQHEFISSFLAALPSRSSEMGLTREPRPADVVVAFPVRLSSRGSCLCRSITEV